MSTTVLIGSIFLVSFLCYLLWDRIEGRKESTVARIESDLSGMGEVIAASLAPKIDPYACIGSTACIKACPEKNVIGLVQGRARLVNALGCIGHGACESACPLDAISLVYGSKTRGVELPRLDPNFQTNRAGIYVAGELGGMGLIANAVNQGRQAADHIITGSPEKGIPPRRGTPNAYDAVIVGAGPAGISATLRLMEAGLRVLLLERESFGGTVMHYPRAKVVMTGPMEFPLYGKVRRKRMSKEELVGVWRDIRTKTNPPLRTGELVEQVTQEPDGLWRVLSTSGECTAANVVLAVGVRGSPRKLDVPGEETGKVFYRLLEPEPFRDKHTLVVGGGNSAVETAIALADFGGCASVGISYRRAQFARCRSDNQVRMAQLVESGQVTAHMNSTVVQIHEKEVVLNIDGSSEVLANDAMVVQIGGTSPSTLLKSFGVELVTKYGER